MKILYLSTWDFTDEESDGVCKKIYSQISALKKEGMEVDTIFLKDGKIIHHKEGKYITVGTVGKIRKTAAYLKLCSYLKQERYEWVYNRYGLMDTFYYQVLKKLHHNGARILVELPTYPYAGEREKGLLSTIKYEWDKLYLNQLKKVVERIVTYSQDKEIWGIPTIQIMNGVDLDKIPVALPSKREENRINLIAVALMQPYHGYERLLYGLKKYKEREGKKDIVFHLVGYGLEKEVYEQIVKENGLEDQVIFYGKKSGKDLNNLYSIADIGVCSLGCYKKGVFWSSELKSREYLARGIPFISGAELDIYPFIDSKVYLQFPNDASPIDMDKVVEFYNKIYHCDSIEVRKNIRELAEKYIDIDKTMKVISEYMKEQT